MTMTEVWLDLQQFDFFVEPFENGSGRAWTIVGNRLPGEFEIAAAEIRIAQLSHDSGALFQTGASAAFDIVEERTVLSRRIDFDVTALGVIAHALLDGRTQAGELFFVNRGVLSEVFEQIGAMFNRKFACGGLDLGDG